MIVEVDKNLQCLRFVGGFNKKGRDCHLEFENLQPGDYLLSIEVDWGKQMINRDLVISSYGDTVSVFYELDCLEEDRMELLKRIFAAYFKTYSSTRAIDYGHLGDKRITRSVDYIFGYLCFYYVNNSFLMTLVEKVRMEQIFGLEICPPFTNNSEFNVNVEQNSDCMVVYKTVLGGNSAYNTKDVSWSYLYPSVDDNHMKEFILSKAKKMFKRKLLGKEIDIMVYVYMFSGGYCLYYVNDSDYVYSEKLSLDLVNLVNLQEEKQKTSIFYIVLRPGEDYLMQFRVKDPSMPFSYESQVSYKIREANVEDEMMMGRRGSMRGSHYWNQDINYGYDTYEQDQDHGGGGFDS